MILYEDDVSAIRWRAIITCILTVLVGLCVAFLMQAGLHKAYEDGYKQACIDFSNGKVRYELVRNQETGETRWERLQK